MSKKIRLEYGHFNWINLILSTDLPFQGKAICMYLGTYMNSKQEVAWPSQARIVKELGLSQASLNKYLNIVEEAGWLVRERGNSTKSTRYYTAFPKEIERELLGTPCDGVGTLPDGVGVLCLTESNKQSNKQTNKYDLEFQEFWNLYPRKVARKKAEESFKRVMKATDFKDILAGLKKYLTVWAGQEADFIPHASTWLNQHRWEDDLNPIAKPTGLNLSSLKNYK